MKPWQETALQRTADCMLIMSDLDKKSRLTIIATLAAMMALEDYGTEISDAEEWLRDRYFPLVLSGLPSAQELLSIADMMESQLATKQ